jgi:dipeptidase E
MRRLLLVSSSTVHPTGYLDHCEPAVKRHFADVSKVLFVPFALADRDAYAGIARKRFAKMGLEMESIHKADDPVRAVEQAEGMFIGGGNTFRLLKCLYDFGLVEPIRRRALEGMPYMGASAGSNMAGPTIKTTNDMPIVFPPSFDALNLVPFQINPHFIDADPNSTHMGETRETRIKEFLEENDAVVVGIREGTMLVVQDDGMTLEGERGGVLFRRGHEMEQIPGGSRLDHLL